MRVRTTILPPHRGRAPWFPYGSLLGFLKLPGPITNVLEQEPDLQVHVELITPAEAGEYITKERMPKNRRMFLSLA